MKQTLKSLKAEIRLLKRSEATLMKHLLDCQQENNKLKGQVEAASNINFGIVTRALKELGINSEEHFFVVEKTRAMGAKLRALEDELKALRVKYSNLIGADAR